MSSTPLPPARRYSQLLPWILLPIALAILVAVAVWPLPSGQDLQAGGAAKKRIPAPSLDGATDWLNSDKKFNLEDFKGRVVLLDFWTLCCINCMHIMPDLAKLEAKYPGVLVVIGIHTPKFDNEKSSASISKAILRYELKHPIINDADRKIWQRYDITSWPSLVLIDPDGNYVGGIAGEGHYDVLDQYISKLVKEFRQKKTLKEDPIEFKLVKESEASPLYFPGKILADEKQDRLFIADSTNHRIVITNRAGKKIAIAGGNGPGLKDGSFAEARFSDPQGMALQGDILYVADRRNHSIRALNLKDETVKLVAGTGKQDGRARGQSGDSLKIGLNSPWDLLSHEGKIYIAMAGHHQIWTFDPSWKRVAPYAGTGEENIGDGSLLNAKFAQPSGLATDGRYLYVADSEISSIRAVPFGGKGQVKTIVGEGLFEFGDVDGVGNQVRLQHALGVAYRDGQLYVADTYNSKIKLIDPVKRSCSTYLSTAGEGKELLFNEPGGLSIIGDTMYVADTNAHRIRVVDMKTKAVTTLQLQGVSPVSHAVASKDEK